MFIHVQNVFFVVSDQSKKKKDDRKRKDMMVHDKRKKPKLSGNGAVSSTASTLSQSDKATIERWNKLHHIGRMSVQTLQGKAEEADARLQQQEELIKSQVNDLDKQQRQLYDQQWLIQEQAEQIRVLLHQQKILIRECKTAGIPIPISTPDPSPLTTPLSSIAKLTSSSSSSPVSSANVPRCSDRVDKPATTSSSSKQMPPIVCPLPPRSHTEPPAQPPPPHHPKLAPPLHSGVVAARPRPYPTLQPRIIQPQAMNFQPPQSVSLPHSYGYPTQQPVQPLPNRSPGYIPPHYPAPNTGITQGMASFNTGASSDRDLRTHIRGEKNSEDAPVLKLAIP